MNRRTRVFLSVAGGVLALGLGTALVASFMAGGIAGLAQQDGPAELDYLPADARVVAFANVRDIMDSELRRRFSEAAPVSGRANDRFREQTGIDVQEDIDYVVAAGRGEAADGDAAGGEADLPGQMLVLARGRFDQGRIEGLVTGAGGTMEEHAGTRLAVRDRLAVAFVEPDLVAIGMPDEVRRAIDAKAGGASVRDNDELMRHVRGVDRSDAWAVARLDAIRTDQLPAEVLSQLPAITWVAVSGWVNGGIDGLLQVETRDEAAATNLRDVVRGFMALARMQTGQYPQIQPLLDSVQLGGQGTTVTLSLALPAEIIDALGALSGEGAEPDPAAPSL